MSLIGTEGSTSEAAKCIIDGLEAAIESANGRAAEARVLLPQNVLDNELAQLINNARTILTDFGRSQFPFNNILAADGLIWDFIGRVNKWREAMRNGGFRDLYLALDLAMEQFNICLALIKMWMAKWWTRINRKKRQLCLPNLCVIQ